jgi:hypothetical protein
MSKPSSWPRHFFIWPATKTVSTLVRSISVTTAPGTLFSGATLIASASSRMMSASLPGVRLNRSCAVELQAPRPLRWWRPDRVRQFISSGKSSPRRKRGFVGEHPLQRDEDRASG